MTVNKTVHTPNAEACDICGSPMDKWQTQYNDEGYDYIQWICSDDECSEVEDRHLYHDNPGNQSELLAAG